MRRFIRAGLTCALCGVAGPLFAQAPRSSAGGASQQIMQQYQQLAAEKTALEAQVAGMKHDLDAAHAELGTVKKERDSLKGRSGANGANSAKVAQLTASLDAAQKSADDSKQRMNELVARFRETATSLKQVETDRDRLQDELRERSTTYDRCAADNLSLYELNGDILERYEQVGFFTRADAGDPFVRITRNRLDNLVDEYRARALELRARTPAEDGKPGGNKPLGP